MIQSVQQDTNEFLADNNDLKNNYDDLKLEIDQIKGQLEYYESVFSEESCTDPETLQAVSSLRTRIEELFDFSEELNNNQGRQEIFQLEELIKFLHGKLEKSKLDNFKLHDRIKSIQKYSGEAKDQNTLHFFSRLLEEKEARLGSLSQKVEEGDIRDKQEIEQIMELEKQIDGLDTVCSDMKDTQIKLNKLVMNNHVSPANVVLNNEVVTENNVYFDQHNYNENPGMRFNYSDRVLPY